MKKLRLFGQRLQVWHVGILLLAISIFFIVRDQHSFIANIGTEIFSISITILIIDRLVQIHEQNNLKASLISQMRSEHNILATDAARRIRDEGWENELEEISLYYANLENAQLYGFNLKKSNLTYGNFRNANLNGVKLDNAQIDDADLSGAQFHKASLRNATVRMATPDKLVFKDAKFFESDLSGAIFLGVFDGVMTESEHPFLQTAFTLERSIMPNGKRYDGRYNLEGDINQAVAEELNTSNPIDMADFYEISVDEYVQGQMWNVKYKEYLLTREERARNLCKQNGLNWDEMNSDERGNFFDVWLKAP